MCISCGGLALLFLVSAAAAAAAAETETFPTPEYVRLAIINKSTSICKAAVLLNVQSIWWCVVPSVEYSLFLRRLADDLCFFVCLNLIKNRKMCRSQLPFNLFFQILKYYLINSNRWMSLSLDTLLPICIRMRYGSPPLLKFHFKGCFWCSEVVQQFFSTWTIGLIRHHNSHDIQSD